MRNPVILCIHGLVNIQVSDYVRAQSCLISFIILATVILTSRRCLETWIRCLHATEFCFLSEYSKYYIQVSESKMQCTTRNQDHLKKSSNNQDIGPHVNRKIDSAVALKKSSQIPESRQ